MIPATKANPAYNVPLIPSLSTTFFAASNTGSIAFAISSPYENKTVRPANISAKPNLGPTSGISRGAPPPPPSSTGPVSPCPTSASPIF